jgi:hypothetical protein
MALEQISAGSIMHLEVLCEAITAADGNEDILLSLQNPYVTLFMERFLERSTYLGALTGRHLSACAALLKAIYPEDQLLASITEACFHRIEGLLEQRNGSSSSRLTDIEETEQSGEWTWTESGVQEVITVSSLLQEG